MRPRRVLNRNDGYVTFVVAITVALAALKLIGLIDWSWWWITIAIWGPGVAIVVLLGTIIVLKAVTGTVDYLIGRRD